MSILKWYVDASHQISEDCSGHTGGFPTFDKGAITSTSQKQKLNTKRSAETELVAVDVVTSSGCDSSLKARDTPSTKTSSTKTTLSLEKNGQISSSGRTKHIKAKYFLVKDKYQKGYIDLQYCPTDVMWADILTKPLQGSKFREMHVIPMNCPI